MRLTACLLGLLALRGVHSTEPADEFQSRLAALSSDRAMERDAAERWLSGHIRAERFSELAAAARAGDAEVRLRLARALGADERHLGVALRFLSESDPSLAGIGREAVHASVVQFDRALGGPAVRGRDLEESLRALAEDGTPRLFRVDPSQPLERTLRALAALGELPVGLVVDEGIAARGLRRRADPVVGSWNVVLTGLAGIQGVAIEAHGRNAQGDPRFLRLTGQREGPARTGVDLVMGWLATVMGSGAPSVRALAARNLIASGFLPAQDWLEARFEDSGDEAALEGLLLAAASGRVSSVLRDPGVVRPMVTRLGTVAEAQAATWLQGLARIGCTTSEGGSTTAMLLRDFEAHDARGRWNRLFLCRELACSDPALEQLASAVLHAKGEPPAVRRMALAALAATGVGASPDLSESERLELFLGLENADEGDRLARDLVTLGLAPPDREARASAAEPTLQRRALLQAWLRAAEPGPAALHLCALVGDRMPNTGIDELAEGLRSLCLEGEARLLNEVLGMARERAPSRSLDRLALLLGALPADDAVAWSTLEPNLLSGTDPVLLGALSGAPAPAEAPAAFFELRTRARAALLARTSAAASTVPTPEQAAALLGGLERALSGALENRRDDEARAFARTVQSTLLPGTRSDLERDFAAFLRQPPGVPILDLEAEGPGRYRLPDSLR